MYLKILILREKNDTKAYLPVVARDQGFRDVWPAKGYEESLGSNGDVL